jgi:O-antigen ligase
LFRSKLGQVPHFQLFSLAIFCIALFMFGGSSRQDVQSLIILTPISVIACATAIATLELKHLEHRWKLLAVFGIAFVLTAIQAIPFPIDLGYWLRADDIADDIKALLRERGAGQSWYYLSLTPASASNALQSLFVPVAILLFGVQLTRHDLQLLLPLLLSIGVVSALMGLLQVVGTAGSSFYLYRITNAESAVGLFANRNHAAIFLASMFPILGAFASLSETNLKAASKRVVIAAIIGLFLIPLILVTGSRSGMLIAVFGIVGGVLLYQPVSSAKSAKKWAIGNLSNVYLLTAATIIGLCVITLAFSRAIAIDRFFLPETGTDSRINFWAISMDIFARYLPVGSGAGSFVEIFQVYEPDGLLDRTYLNRAHNDWIETAVTFGGPGVVLALLALLFFVRRTFLVWRMDGGRRSVVFARLASLNLAMLGVASLSDYPLRTPALMGFATLMVLWFIEPDGQNQREKCAV